MVALKTSERKPSFLKQRKIQTRVVHTVVYAILSILSVFFLIPLLWMVSTSLKDPRLILANPPVWIPPHITLENFSKGLQLMLPSFQRLFFNTTSITVLSVIGTLFSSSIVAFGFAIFPARGKKVLFTLVLATMMIPTQVTLIPQFILFAKLGWRDTWLPLIVPTFFAAPFFVFMFRQFYSTIPRDLYDSAELDGCSPIQMYLYLALPLSKPAFVTAGIFAFLGAWNDLTNPLVYLSNMNKFTLTLGLAMFQGTNFTLLQYLMPMALLSILPVLILFFLAQKYFVQGIVTTGMKG
jgi:multiple sugar transport system permease protein